MSSSSCCCHQTGHQIFIQATRVETNWRQGRNVEVGEQVLLWHRFGDETRSRFVCFLNTFNFLAICYSHIERDTEFLMVYSQRRLRSKCRRLMILGRISIIADYLQREYCFIHGFLFFHVKFSTNNFQNRGPSFAVPSTPEESTACQILDISGLFQEVSQEEKQHF